MSILDNWAGSVSGSIISLSANEIIDVNASQISSNYYEATVPLISSYATNLKVNLKTNATCSGAVTLNINGLGTKTLKKVDATGTLVDLASGDIVSGAYGLFIYNGTYFVLIGALVGTSGSGTITGSYTGVSPITVTGSQISHAVSGVTSGSYNQIIVDAKGHVTAGSFITITSGSGGTTYSGSALITVSGSKISHNTSTVISGSGNQFIVDAYGHITSASFINITSGSGGMSSISGSTIMSDTSGSIVKHNVSGVSPDTYLAANITIDQWGHITSAANGTSASSTGAPSDSPFVTSGSSASLTNARILTAGSNISIDKVSGSIIIHSTASSGSGAYATIWEPRANPSSSNAKDDEFSGSSLNAKWTIWDVGSCITSASPIENGLQIIPSLSNITKMAGIVQSAPSTPFTVWTKLQTNGFNGGLYWSLLVGANLIANPTSGSFYTGGLWNTGIGADWRVSYWDNYNNAFNRPLCVSAPNS